MEGLEETLALHRLGLFEELGRTFKTTNAIENVNGLLGRYLGKVNRWMHSLDALRSAAALDRSRFVGGRTAHATDR
jgi:hypothetical protein